MKSRVALAALLVLALTIVPALLAGHYLNRWGTTTELEAAAKMLVQFPNEFGAWKSTHDGEPLTPYVVEELGIASYVSRQYENQENAATVNMLLMVGQAGPLLRHPPNICYANRANRQVGDEITFQIDQTTPASQFTAMQYEPPGGIASDRFIVAYAMSTGREWSVPRYPRLAYGAAPLLYKVQILSTPGSTQESDKGVKTAEKFAADFTAAFTALQLQSGVRNDDDREEMNSVKTP